MTPLGVTGLTQQGCSTLEQRCMYGTVRCVAQGAIFTDRGMIEQHRPAILSMTIHTEFIGRVLDQQCGRDGRVRVVTTCAGHGSRPRLMIGSNRVRRRLHAVGSLAFMAVKANVRLQRM